MKPAAPFYDRLTGSTSSSLADGTFGRWQVQAVDGLPSTQNGILAEPGAYLVPDARGAFSVGNGAGTFTGSFAAPQLPSEFDAGAIVALGRILDDLINHGAGLHAWLRTAPLVPGMSKRTEVLTFEHDIAEHLAALEAVCHRPRTYLQVEVERVPAARARRVPVKSLNYLAAHMEDWEQVTLCGVRPRRVLALVPDDEIDIYENRVAARLVDHLDAYLRHRIQEVKRLNRFFLEAADYGEDAAVGWHRRRHRIFSLWGLEADDAAVLKSTRTLRLLERLQRQVAGLKDSRLHRAVPKRTQLGTSLTQTNILANDPRYVRVARLWHLWARNGHARPRSSAQVYAEQQALCRGFTAFCVLLLVHALDQLHYTCNSGEALRPGSALLLESPQDACVLEWKTDDTLVLRTVAGPALLRIIPLPSMLKGLLAIRPQEIAALLGAAQPGTLILYPAAPLDAVNATALPGAARLHSIGNDLAKEQVGIGALPVSPWSIASVERVARALRYALLAPQFLAYPPAFDALDGELLAFRTLPFVATDGKRWKLTRPPRRQEQAQLRLDTVLGDAQLEAERQRHELSRVMQERRANLDNDRIRGSLNEQKTRLDRLVKEAEAHYAALTQFKESFERSVEKLLSLLLCPICGQVEQEPYRGFQAHDGTFQCACAACETTWGSKTCIHCRTRFAFMWPKVALPPLEERPSTAGWVDDLLGCDVLAVPCARSPALEPSYICPACGDCPCCQPHSGDS